MIRRYGVAREAYRPERMFLFLLTLRIKGEPVDQPGYSDEHTPGHYASVEPSPSRLESPGPGFSPPTRRTLPVQGRKL